jgi:hypothetical protein
MHTVEPRLRDEHLRRLASAEIDVDGIQANNQFELSDWTNTHLCGGDSISTRSWLCSKGSRRTPKRKGFRL